MKIKITAKKLIILNQELKFCLPCNSKKMDSHDLRIGGIHAKMSSKYQNIQKHALRSFAGSENLTNF